MGVIWGFIVFLIGACVGALVKDFLKGLTDSSAERFGHTMRSRLRRKNPASEEVEVMKIGALQTSLHVLDGNGVAIYGKDNIEAVFRSGAPDSPDDISDRILFEEREMERLREEGNTKVWDGIGVGLLRYRPLRSNDEKKLGASIEFYKSRYAEFRATVRAIALEDRNSDDSIFKRYLDGRSPADPVSFLARHVGIVAVVITSDNVVIATKRQNATGIRPNEFDVSIVEGIEPTKDADTSGDITLIDIYKSVSRGCREELGFTPDDSEIKIIGFAVDMNFYQYNFISLIFTKLSFKEIKDNRNGKAKDQWESKIIPLNYNIEEILEFINSKNMWGFASVALYWSLMNKFTRAVIEARASQIVLRKH